MFCFVWLSRAQTSSLSRKSFQAAEPTRQFSIDFCLWVRENWLKMCVNVVSTSRSKAASKEPPLCASVSISTLSGRVDFYPSEDTGWNGIVPVCPLIIKSRVRNIHFCWNYIKFMSERKNQCFFLTRELLKSVNQLINKSPLKNFLPQADF